MSLTSFLTQSPAINQQNQGQAFQSLPQWYNDYASGILSNAAQFAGQGPPMFPGPQVAGLTPDQQASYGTVQGQQGVGSGLAQQGFNTVSGAAGMPNASQASNPYLQQSQSGIYGALGQPNAAQAGNPYLNAASAPISSQMGQFMNPYMQNVVNTGNTLTSRNFTENVLPALQDQFTAAGQVGGGSQQGLYAERMARDLNLNQQMASGNLLAGGFNTALQGAQGQQQLYGQLGANAGNLANAAQGTGLYGAGLLGSLGSTAGGMANASQQTGIGAGLAQGFLGSTVQNNALQQAMAQNQMGQQQQAQTQQNYNTALNNYMQQFNWPMTASGAMGQALGSVIAPMGQQRYDYGSPPAGYGGSPLGSALGTYGLVSGLGNIFGFGSKGGRVQSYKKGGRVLHLKPRVKSPLEYSHG